MSQKTEYENWKKGALKAVEEGRTVVCDGCNDPIVPGDFIGICRDGKGKKVFVHAGYHFALSNISAFCETAGIGSAYWDGKQAVARGESAIATAFRTGEVQVS